MKKRVHLLVRTAVAALLLPAGISGGFAQDNFTPNGIADFRQNAFAFTHANNYQPDGSYLNNATLLIREGRIVEVGASIDVSAGYFEVDLGGRYIYPGFVDIYTQYGIPTLEREVRTSGAENLFSADQALKADKIGDVFDSQYILKVSGDSYKRADLISDTGASLIVPIDFPDAPKVDDVIEADDRIGTLEVGKDATLFVSTGDALDMRTSQILGAYIQGRDIDLFGTQQQLYERFRDKYSNQVE